jgi:tRNA (guanosine-2'-O-)-methyltransferase
MSKEAPRRLRRAEAVLLRRTSRIILVIERPTDAHNVQAVFRTAESFGIQHVWYVESEGNQGKRISKSVAKGSNLWLSLRSFDTPETCLDALRKLQCPIWATALEKTSEMLKGPESLAPFPAKVALVMGRESDGISKVMRAAADRLLYLPMQGFTESFNLSVATALVLQRCFDACPEMVGDMDEKERATLRELWYENLAKSADTKRLFPSFLADPPAPLEDHRPSDENRRPRIPKKVRKALGMDEI